MNLIQKCHEEYLNSFPERWIDNINEKDNTEIRVAFDKINQFRKAAFIFLSNSVLVGEYISDDNSKEKIELFLKDIKFLDYTSTQSNIARIYEQFIDFNLNLFNDLRHYQKLIDISDRKYEVSEIKKEFGIFELKTRPDKNSFSDFSAILIPICIYDYRFPMDDNSLMDLLNLRFTVEKKNEKIKDAEKNIEQIYLILLDKCNFFLKKARREDIHLRFNSKVSKISPESLSIGGLQILIDKEHKNIFFTASTIKTLEANIYSDNPQVASFVQLMRYYKETLTDKNELGKMDSIIYLFERLYKSHKVSPKTKKEEYDNFALDTVRNYLYNCKFSFISKFEETSFSEIETELGKIIQVQADGVKNFHPYEKGIKFLRKRIHIILQKNAADCSQEDFQKVERKINRLNELIENYEKSIKWCEYRKFYPFLLPFNESLIVDNGLLIFVPSTFARAIDYSEQAEYLEASKQDFRELKSLYVVKKEQKTIIKSNDETKNRTIELENNVKGYEKRTYELLAIFTAIITFLFGAVNIFTANTQYDLFQLITNTIGLGLLLILFSTLVLATTSKFIVGLSWSDFFKTVRFWILLIFLLSIPVIMFLTKKSMPPSPIIEELNETKKEPIIQTHITIPVSNPILKDTIKINTHNHVNFIIEGDSIVKVNP